MANFAGIFLIVYAVLMLVGGFMGYRLGNSRPSLIAGLISGLALLGAWAWTRSSPQAGFLAAAVVALVLAGFFLTRVTGGKFMPSGVFLILSVVALIIFGMAGLRRPM